MDKFFPIPDFDGYFINKNVDVLYKRRYKEGRLMKPRMGKNGYYQIHLMKDKKRKQKKRNFRSLWITRINAGARAHGMSYSQFMGGVKKNGIELNRKVLADLAMNHPEAFKTIALSLK